MTVYDPVTNEPVTPSPLDEAEHDLLAALSLRQHADTAVKRETAARIVARCRLEIARLRALEDSSTGPVAASTAPPVPPCGRVSGASTLAGDDPQASAAVRPVQEPHLVSTADQTSRRPLPANTPNRKAAA